MLRITSNGSHVKREIHWNMILCRGGLWSSREWVFLSTPPSMLLESQIASQWVLFVKGDLLGVDPRLLRPWRWQKFVKTHTPYYPEAASAEIVLQWAALTWRKEKGLTHKDVLFDHKEGWDVEVSFLGWQRTRASPGKKNSRSPHHDSFYLGGGQLPALALRPSSTPA